ncbi:MAG: helix-turn-helix domain-containing protein [Deltaproteobacteria bacterium]|nr:helix-turn-helix domain-containing protein [Deltaproteobacteria bacterium]
MPDCGVAHKLSGRYGIQGGSHETDRVVTGDPGDEIFEEAYYGWQERRLTQDEAACLLGVCARAFRRYINRYEEEGLEGLYDKRITRASHRSAPATIPRTTG